MPSDDTPPRPEPLPSGGLPSAPSAPPAPPPVPPAPVVTAEGVVWRVPLSWAPGGVRLEVDWVLSADPEFSLANGDWMYRLARPAAWRFEYRLLLRGGERNGSEGGGPGPDPASSATLPNAFGSRSEIRFPDYTEPVWLKTPAAGRSEQVLLGRGRLDLPVPVRLWSPAGVSPETPAPLLIAHDGSGLAEDGSLLSWAARHAAAHRPVRLALLDAPEGHRNLWYAANPDYLDHLASVVVPGLREHANVTGVAALGISLGALSMLALQRRHPDALDALAIQSGSFFTPELDGQESGYPYFDQVCRAVAELKSGVSKRVVPVLATCGAIEENLANNVAMVRALEAQGYPVDFHVVPDAHTMIGWRDAWSPGLDTLLDRLG